MENCDTKKPWECTFLIVNSVHVCISTENTLFKMRKTELGNRRSHGALGLQECLNPLERDMVIL